MFDRRGGRKYLNTTEREAFFTSAIIENDLERKAFCLTLYFTGCRISEARNMTVGRIDFAEKCLVFETLKRRKRGIFRAVPIPDLLLRLLGELTMDFKPSTHVWTFSRSTGYRLIKEHMRRARISGSMGCPKGLRHALAVACLGHQIPLPVVKSWLGHSRLDSTAVYLDVMGEEERKLAERLW